ncbi:MAG: hypothetical protein KDC36_01695 [Thermoleophilia bacterium]|nr:hypothetical protein [Thermoleophilia bacterium]
MTALTESPLRLVSLIVAAVLILPTSVLIVRHLGALHAPEAGSGERALDAVWTVLPIIALVGLLVWAGVA